jgi:hypothetical protein
MVGGGACNRLKAGVRAPENREMGKAHLAWFPPIYAPMVSTAGPPWKIKELHAAVEPAQTFQIDA